MTVTSVSHAGLLHVFLGLCRQLVNVCYLYSHHINPSRKFAIAGSFDVAGKVVPWLLT